MIFDDGGGPVPPMPLGVTSEPHPIFAMMCVIALVVALVALQAIITLQDRKIEKLLSERRLDVERKADAQPENPRLAWDLARVTLEQYFNRNLQQVSQIFYASIVAMFVGFGLIVWGVILAIHQSSFENMAAILPAASGVITEFISVTFMVVYRSTLQQANGYMAILEKINAVGMAVQIIETIPPTDPLYSETRAAIAKQLLEQNRSHSKQCIHDE